MEILLWILLATFVDSLVGLIGVFSLWIKDGLLEKILAGLIAFSAGTLIGGAFFHLLPESLESIPAMTTFGYAIIGFVVFFLVEGFFHWHLCERCEEHPFTYLMLVGDAIHNFIDGLVIAASFYVSIPLGIVTSLVIVAHEAPQEAGLFGVLIHGKLGKNKAVFYSFLAQITVILGGLAGYFASGAASSISIFLIPFAAGGFLYIAAADIVPEMHRMYRGNFRRSLEVVSTFFAGIVLMLVIKVFFGA